MVEKTKEAEAAAAKEDAEQAVAADALSSELKAKEEALEAHKANEASLVEEKEKLKEELEAMREQAAKDEQELKEAKDSLQEKVVASEAQQFLSFDPKILAAQQANANPSKKIQ